MMQEGMKLVIDPEILRKLKGEETHLWRAAHEDGTDNRIDGDAVLEAAGYHEIFGILAAGIMWVRKKFRNRGKTKDDFAAEKEAAKINRTCGALEEMLLEYLRAAQEGRTDPELLEELTDTLREMSGYEKAGKLVVPGRKELTEICRSIAEYTGAAESAAAPAADEFARIRELVERQKEQA